MQLLSRRYRIHARELSFNSWVASGFDVPKAKELTRQKVSENQSKGEYGNPIMALYVAYLILSICYLAFKFWKETQVKVPPWKSQPGEPFGL